MARIMCYTLFNITHTGIPNNRSIPNNVDPDHWVKMRNTQCNYDTLMQVISLRSLPEVMKEPMSKNIMESDLDKFGFLYNLDTEEPQQCWTFEIEVSSVSSFNDGIREFGLLYKDCEGVPMIKCEEQYQESTDFLNGSDELRNIYFEVV